MYEDYSGILMLVIRCLGITNTSNKISLFEFPFLKLYWGVCRKFVNLCNIHVSSLFVSSLRAIVICQKYFRITVISSKIRLFVHLLVMSHCTVICVCTGLLRLLRFG